MLTFSQRCRPFGTVAVVGSPKVAAVNPSCGARWVTCTITGGRYGDNPVAGRACRGGRRPRRGVRALQGSIKIVPRFSELIEALAEATGQFRQFLGPKEHQHNH